MDFEFHKVMKELYPGFFKLDEVIQLLAAHTSAKD